MGHRERAPRCRTIPQVRLVHLPLPPAPPLVLPRVGLTAAPPQCPSRTARARTRPRRPSSSPSRSRPCPQSPPRPSTAQERNAPRCARHPPPQDALVRCRSSSPISLTLPLSAAPQHQRSGTPPALRALALARARDVAVRAQSRIDAPRARDRRARVQAAVTPAEHLVRPRSSACKCARARD